jgi:hypothetical protein
MHGTTADFWKEYRALPADIRERADKQFALLKANPPSFPAIQKADRAARAGNLVRARHAQISRSGCEGR